MLQAFRRDDTMSTPGAATMSLVCEEWSGILLKNIGALYDAKHMCDTIILSKDGVVFNAHRCVLVASSPKIKIQLLTNDSDIPVKIIYLAANSQHIRILLDFMYTGILNCEEDQLESVLDCARLFEIVYLDKLNVFRHDSIEKDVASTATSNPQHTHLPDNDDKENEHELLADGVDGRELYKYNETTENCFLSSDKATVSSDSCRVTSALGNAGLSQTKILNDSGVSEDQTAQRAPLDQVQGLQQERVTKCIQDSTISEFLKNSSVDMLEPLGDNAEGNVMLLTDIVTNHDNVHAEDTSTVQNDVTVVFFDDTVVPCENIPEADVDNLQKPSSISEKMPTPDEHTVPQNAETPSNNDHVASRTATQHSNTTQVQDKHVTKLIPPVVTYEGSTKIFSCSHCEKTCSSTYRMKQHLLSHILPRGSRSRSEEGYICKTCGEKCKTYFALHCHLLKLDHGTRVVKKCEKCQKEFTNLAKFKIHCNNDCKDEALYTCSVCNHKFDTKNELSLHILEHVSTNPHMHHVCNTCGSQHKSGKLLKTHILRYHSGRNWKKCDVCDVEFTSVKDMKQHRKIHGQERRKYSCRTCGEQFSSSSEHQIHQGRHKHFLCERCGVNLKCKAKHACPVTMKRLKYESSCQHCNKTFSTPNEKHRHNCPNYKPFVCSFCGWRFSLIRNLRNHERKVHTSATKCKCTECGITFSRRLTLNCHLWSAHNKKPSRRFKCETCNKTFLYKTNLTAHTRFHTGDLVYCNICNRGFPHNSNMLRHRSKHFCDLPYSCDLCSLKFRLKRELVEHRLEQHLAGIQ